MKLAEDIIISKRYFELTSSEKEVVKELVSNEEEYEAMRWFLTSTGDAFTQEKIEPSRDLKKGVMAHLQQKQTTSKTIWLNGVSAFLFPAEKKFYQYPGLQIAAVAVLLVSAVAIYNSSSKIQDTLAVNETEQLVTSEEKLVFESETMVPETTGALQDEEAAQPTTVTRNEIVDDVMEAPADMAPGEAVSYYREMSVAEEMKLAEQDDESPAAVLDVDNVSTGSGSTLKQDQTVNLSSTLNKKNVDLKQEAVKSKDSDKVLRDETKRNDNSKSTTTVSTNAPAGNIGYTTTEKEKVKMLKASLMSLVRPVGYLAILLILPLPMEINPK
ncbi:MAG: hypothetical protein IPG07_06540 [Crocinitomicaceae bacterium]|nr:hypothetical protein [Crocinitomicaceae bacterium]